MWEIQQYIFLFLYINVVLISLAKVAVIARGLLKGLVLFGFFRVYDKK